MAPRVNALVLSRRHLLVCPLAACSPRQTSAPHIVFIGDGPEDAFDPWRKFQKAWRERQGASTQSALLVYLHTPTQDPVGKRAAIATAVNRGATVLVAPTGSSALMAAQAGRAPVVFASFIDPVRAGLARSDRIPGGHVTGISLADFLDAKRLLTLRDAFTGIRRVGVLTDRSWAEHYQGETRVITDAKAVGLQATMYYCDAVADLDALMTQAGAMREHAWYVMPTNVAYVAEARILEHLRRLQAPGMFSTVGEVQRGGALAYVADSSFVYPKLAELVARVVNGEDAGRIPIERPRRFMLVARADARSRGAPISARLLRRADQIV